MKLNLGCGGKHYPDFCNLDIRPGAGDKQWDCSTPLPYPDNSIEEIRMDAFFEHLFRTDAVTCLKDWYKKLIAGGILLITRVPDFDIVIKDYQEGYFKDWQPCSELDIAYGAIMGAPAGPDIGQLHKNIYTKESLERMIKVNTAFKEVVADYCINKISREENEFPKDNYGLWIRCVK